MLNGKPFYSRSLIGSRRHLLCLHFVRVIEKKSKFLRSIVGHALLSKGLGEGGGVHIMIIPNFCDTKLAVVRYLCNGMGPFFKEKCVFCRVEMATPFECNAPNDACASFKQAIDT